MDIIYTAFYTPGRYEQEANRLRHTLDKHGLRHDIRQVSDRGNWMLNTHHTACHICAVLDDYRQHPVVYLDADAVVWQRPVLFEQLAADGVTDIAVHYRKGKELLNGTAYFAPNSIAWSVAQLYRYLITSRPGETNEQRLLGEAIDKIRPNVYRLPPSYCWIHDIMREDIGQDKPVIEHLQCSREMNVTPFTAHRHARLAEIEPLLLGSNATDDLPKL